MGRQSNVAAEIPQIGQVREPRLRNSEPSGSGTRVANPGESCLARDYPRHAPTQQEIRMRTDQMAAWAVAGALAVAAAQAETLFDVRK